MLLWNHCYMASGPRKSCLLQALASVILLLAVAVDGCTTITVLCAPLTEFDPAASLFVNNATTDNATLRSIVAVDSDADTVPMHCRADVVWPVNTTAALFAGSASVSWMLEVTTYRSPTFFVEGLTQARRSTVLVDHTNHTNATTSAYRNATLRLDVAIAGIGLWRLAPALYLVVEDSNGTVTSVRVTAGVTTVLDDVTIADSTHVVLRPSDSSDFRAVALLDVLPANGSLAVSSTALYVRFNGALVLSSCAAAMTLRTTQVPHDGTDAVAPTTIVAPLDFTNGSYTLLHVLTNPFATAVVAAYAAINLTCWVPQQTLLILEQEQLARNAMLNVSSTGSNRATSGVLFDVPLSTRHALYVLPVPSPVVFPSFEAVTHADGSRSFPFQFVVSTAKPVGWAHAAGGMNVSQLLLERRLAVGVFVYQVPSAMDELLLQQLGERAAQSGSVFVQAEVVRETEASVFASVTITSGDTSVCAYSQMLSDGVAMLSFQRSPIACVVYRFPTGVELWVYQLIAVLLAVVLGIVLMDDVVAEIERVRYCKKRSSSSRGGCRRATSDAVAKGALSSPLHSPLDHEGPAQQQQNNDTDGSGMLQLFNISSPLGGAPTSAAAQAPRGGGGTQPPMGMGAQLQCPMSANRQAYLRGCAIFAALWDVVSIVVSIVFVIVCLAKGRFLSLLLAMVGVLLVSVLALALRVHVTLFAMPSRLALREDGDGGRRRRGVMASGHHHHDPTLGAGVRGMPSTRHLGALGGRNRRRQRNDPEEVTVSMVDAPVEAGPAAAAAPHVRGVPARCPLASHFWPGVNLFVLAVDATGCELRFTEPARSFWYGVQRWVHDVPALVVALIFTTRYPTATNAASVAQVFCAAAAIALGYRGVLVAAAVPLLVVISRFVSSLGASNIEEWVRGRTGLQVVAATEAPKNERRSSTASAAEAARTMAALTTPHVAALHARTFSVSSIPPMSTPYLGSSHRPSFLGSHSNKSASPTKHGSGGGASGRVGVVRVSDQDGNRRPAAAAQRRIPNASATTLPTPLDSSDALCCVGVDTPRHDEPSRDDSTRLMLTCAATTGGAMPVPFYAAVDPTTVNSHCVGVDVDGGAMVDGSPGEEWHGSRCHGSAAALPVMVVYSDSGSQNEEEDEESDVYLVPGHSDELASEPLPSTLASPPSHNGASSWVDDGDDDDATIVVHDVPQQSAHEHARQSTARYLRNVRGRHPIPYPLWTPLINASASQVQ